MTSGARKAVKPKDTELGDKIKQTMQKLEALTKGKKLKSKQSEKKVFLQLVTNPKNSKDKAYLFQHQQFALARVKDAPGAIRGKCEAYAEVRGVLTAEGGEGELVPFELFSKGELDALGELLPYVKNDMAIIDLARKAGV